ncbi:unnamed protein product [Paramecium octaurelia]|uniref:Trichocyst matrix protein n=1 Tax=Paramecium octaurelia TaxID=43137 RepID=A0A8S1X126_PAROT|nr:unnamed protein product [Paramecium octaurelia]
MKLCIVFLVICLVISQKENTELSQEDQTLLDSMFKDKFGLNVLNDIQSEYRKDSERKEQLVRIESLLNTIERQIAQDEQDDLEQLTKDQELYNQQLESLKEKIAEAQYDYSSIGATIRLLEDESNRYDTQINEKENIVNEYESTLTQLEEIRQHENAYFEITRDDSFAICSLIKRARYLIRELLPRSPRNVAFVQQYTYEDNSHQFSSSDVLQQMRDLQVEAQETLQNNEPFLKIINEFVTVSTQTEAVIDTTRANAIINLLQQLYDQVDSTNRVQLTAEDDRENLHQRVKDQINGELDYLNLQLSILQDEQDGVEAHIIAAQMDQKDGEQRLANLKQSFQDLQKCKEDSKVNYGVRSKERKEQLKLLRKAREVLLNEFDAVRCYIEDILNRSVSQN